MQKVWQWISTVNWTNSLEINESNWFRCFRSKWPAVIKLCKATEFTGVIKKRIVLTVFALSFGQKQKSIRFLWTLSYVCISIFFSLFHRHTFILRKGVTPHNRRSLLTIAIYLTMNRSFIFAPVFLSIIFFSFHKTNLWR